MQEDPAVAAHRAGDVAQHDKRRRAPAPALALQLDQAARAQRGAHRRAQIGAAAVPVGGEAAGRHILDRQAQPRDRGLGAGQFFERHLLEIHAAQLLAVGKGHDRVDLGFGLLRLAGGLLLVRMQCLGQPPRHLGAPVFFGFNPHFGQHQAHHLFQQIRIAPKDVKRLVENQPLVRPVDEHRMQCPVEVAPVGNPDRPHRIDRIDDLTRPNRQPRRAQSARKMHQIGEQPPAGFRRLRHDFCGQPSPYRRYRAGSHPLPHCGRGCRPRTTIRREAGEGDGGHGVTLLPRLRP